MKSISNIITHTLVIKKSRFICTLIPIQNEEDVKTYLQKQSEQYIGASHHSFAYICGNKKRCSDAGEPSGTAGMPILNVLEKNDLQYILAIVTRYYGGIKLGAGGLVRAYSSVVSEAYQKSKIVDLVPGKKIILSFPYAHEKQIGYILKQANILKKNYDEQVHYEVELELKMFQNNYDHLYTLSTIQKEENIFIKKEV